MILMQKYRSFLLIILMAMCLVTANAQQEGALPTQALVALDGKTPGTPTPSNVTVKVDNKQTPLTGIARVVPGGVEVALLIDDGLRVSVGRELADLQNFVRSLSAGTEIFIGYMQNGRVVPAQDFTTDFAAAAQALHVPTGSPGSSASPYLCLSDFVKKWPVNVMAYDMNGVSPPPKARFVLMITNGVDPYNGSDSVLNQDSPYVAAAVTDAQRVGVPVYSIYFSDAGMRGGAANLSGQSYLSQVADGTGGRSYYEGSGNPVSFTPFLKEFQSAISETYVASFDAPGRKGMVNLKFSTNLTGTKVRSANEVRPGTRIGAGQ